MKQKRRLSYFILSILLSAWFCMHKIGANATNSPNSPITSVQLGEMLFLDKNISVERNMGCVTCHDKSAGFADPRSANNPRQMPVSPGSLPDAFGRRNAMSAAYAVFSPPFHWDEVNQTYVGGQFWDGRADSLAAQASGPPLNPLEMAFPNRHAVLDRLAENPTYLEAFQRLYGVDLRSKIEAIQPAIYEKFGVAIADFEPTSLFVEFNSKYDLWMAGDLDLNDQEKLGLNLFNGKANCASCHISESTDTIPALFTDFTYDNLGIPKNPRIDELAKQELPPDLGLGSRPDIKEKHPDGSQNGKFKVPTLRNIALTAPYGHNGIFATLEEIVHFYNTRDVLGRVESADDPGSGNVGWPPPEVPENVNTNELGNLDLTAEEEAAVVAFLKTLTDNFHQ